MPHDPAALAPTDADRFQRFLDRAEQIRHDHMIAGVLALGRAAVEELYDGEVARIHDRAAARDEPLAVLAQQFAERMAWLGLNLDRIRAAIRAWEVDRQLPPAAQGQLLPTQLRALAVVPSPADRARLALKAVDASWTAAQTADEVGAYRLRTGLVGKGGRKPQPAVLKQAAAAHRKLEQLGEPEQLAELALAQRVALRQELRAIKAAAELWLGRLA